MQGKQETRVPPRVGKISLEKEIAAYTSIPAWDNIQRKPTGWQRVEPDLVTEHTL